MKRFLSLCLAALLIAASMTSCSAAREMSSGAPMSEVWSAFKADLFGEQGGTYTEIRPQAFAPTEYKKTTEKLAYKQLETEDMRAAYKSIEESIYFIDDEKDEKSGFYKTKIAAVPNLNTLELFKVKEAVLEDHPEAFWLNGQYAIGYNRTDGDYVSLYCSVSGSKAQTMAQSLTAAVDIFFAGMPGGLTEYERELYIHDGLIKHCEYDYDAYDDTDPNRNPNAFTAYGALVDRKAVCGGYSIAAKLLFNHVGIDSMTVSGTSKGQGHMWNVVKISDVWYQLDVTWDDPSTDSGGLDVAYWYFNLNDEYMQRNHVYGVEFSDLTNEMVEKGETTGYYNFDIPACESLEHNLLIEKSLPIDLLKYSTQRKINDYVDKVVADGEDLLYFDIDDTLDFNKAVKWLAESGAECAIDRAANLANSKFAGRQIIGKKVFTFNQDDAGVLWKRIVIIKLIYEE